MLSVPSGCSRTADPVAIPRTVELRLPCPGPRHRPGRPEGHEILTSSHTFAELGVPAPIVAELHRSDISAPFPIQQAVLPDAIAGRDIAGRAPTGSGKTLAFGIPLVVRVARAQRRRPTGLVLAPTRELASQIADALRPVAAAGDRSVAAIFGGVGYGPQRRALDKGVDVVVACPGRLEDLLAQGALRLDDVEVVVVDEADRMADMGFLPAVRRIVDAASSRQQTMVFSATFDAAVTKLMDQLGVTCVRHDVVRDEDEHRNTRHFFWDVDRDQRVGHAAEVAAAMPSTFFFCRTRHGADRLAKQLARQGIDAAPIHGGRSQPQRARALDQFRQGQIRALVATDVAARGIHVDDVAAVVHFDPPADHATYLHRSGRTARAGASGVVVSFVDERDRAAAKALQRTLGVERGFAAANAASLLSSAPAPAPLPAASSPEGPTRSEPATMGTGTVTGTVKFFDAGRGFGFIARSDGDDVFVHASNVEGDRSRPLRDGQRVEFEIGPGRKGPEARSVRPR